MNLNRGDGASRGLLAVLACRARRDGTSGGLCTHKYLELLAGMGPVVAAAGDIEEETGQVAAERKISPLSNEERIRLIPAACANDGAGWVVRLPRAIRGKMEALASYSTGFPPQEWRKVRRWRGVVRQILGSGETPRVVFAFGAGMDFTPHMALATWKEPLPWVAYYHDPWPAHLYPPPYRAPWNIPGWHQERWHRRILHRAPALAFPSARLRDWILCADLEPLRTKAFILPHLATGPEVSKLERGEGLPPQFERSGFQIVHAGTLLRHRSPWALLEGFHRFVSKEEERQRRAKLWMVGRVDRHIAPDPRWKELTRSGCVEVMQERVSYEASMQMLLYATAGVVLEAIAPESPFYPGKLADLLYLRKPILAVTPSRSTVRDMLGEDYPLLCLPDRAEDVESKLELLWQEWKRGGTARLGPPEEAVRMASPETARREVGRILMHLEGELARGAGQS